VNKSDVFRFINRTEKTISPKTVGGLYGRAAITDREGLEKAVQEMNADSK
jgi:hypothetical protein